MSYLDTAQEVYKEAALCSWHCAPRSRSQALFLPGLTAPPEMLAMDFGCGTAVHVGEIRAEENVAYIGVGGALEPFLFSYFTRRPRSIVAVDCVSEMLEKAATNLQLATRTNNWFHSEFVELLLGNALHLPLHTQTFDIAAQNGLFNIFEEAELQTALNEAYRILKPGGRLYIADPIATEVIPERLRKNECLRARCLSGPLPLEVYLNAISASGFDVIEIRKRSPYRVLDQRRFQLSHDIPLYSIELVAYKPTTTRDRTCVLRGETLIYSGPEESLDIGDGHHLMQDVPHPVCQKLAAAYRASPRCEITVTEPTYHYFGTGNCCG